jgi:translation initiation factor 3 subunit J
VRLALRRPRLSNPARRDAARPRRGTPRDACRRRQLRFSGAFEVARPPTRWPPRVPPRVAPRPADRRSPAPRSCRDPAFPETTDDEEFEVPDLAAETAAKAKITSDPRFADEDAEEPEVKKPAVKKPAVVKKTVAEYVDETLDDPVAEKARRQKLVEQADLEAAKELFGTDGAEVDLSTYNPKSEKEFTKFGRLVATKFMTPVTQSAFYKEAVKSFNTHAVKNMTAAEVKEVEATLVAIRNEKVKAEKAESLAAAKAATLANQKSGKGKKKFLNQGTKGGDSGLDDYKYETYDVEDELDFM